MGYFDTIINYGIPLGIIVWLAFLFYIKFKEVFDKMFMSIGKLFGNIFGAVSGKTKSVAEDSYEIVYNYGR